MAAVKATVLTLAVQQIKDTISAQDVGEAMGLEIRHGRCRCPLHGGGDFNCVLYKGNRGFYCHTCKRGGDVLKLVQEYYGTSFKNTVAWFNDTFHMGLELDMAIDPAEAKRAEMALQMRKEAQAHEAWMDLMRFDLFLLADMILEKLEEQRDLNRPKTPDESWNTKFCEAVRLIPAAKRFAQRCLADCVKNKKE